MPTRGASWLLCVLNLDPPPNRGWIEAELASPEVKTVVDVVGIEEGRVATSIIEKISGDEIVLTLPQDREQRLIRLKPGTRLELIWKDPDGLLALPVQVVASQA